jgi:ribulose-phosphate 3-epimerase
MAQSLLDLKIPALAPSILTADFGNLREQIQQAEFAGVDAIHLDVMDGHFVPNISFGPLVVSAVRAMTSLPLDVHLMVQHPERYIDAFAEAGADIISIHVEATPHPHRAVQQIHAGGAYSGIAINPATSLSAVEELLYVVDIVLVMSVNPGFGGQSFIPETLGKVQRLRSMLGQRDLEDVRIEVDGGIKAENIWEAHSAGADIFVCGSSVFNDQSSVASSVNSLREALR